MSKFSHRDPQISPKPFSNHFLVDVGSDSALSAVSWTADSIAQFLVSFYCLRGGGRWIPKVLTFALFQTIIRQNLLSLVGQLKKKTYKKGLKIMKLVMLVQKNMGYPIK